MISNRLRVLVTTLCSVIPVLSYAESQSIDNSFFSLSVPSDWTFKVRNEQVVTMPEGSQRTLHITPGPYMATGVLLAEGPDRMHGTEHVPHRVDIGYSIILPPLEPARIENFQSSMKIYTDLIVAASAAINSSDRYNEPFKTALPGGITLYSYAADNAILHNCFVVRSYLTRRGSLEIKTNENMPCSDVVPSIDQITSTLHWK